MLQTKPTFIEENGKAKFVVFSMKDYAAIKEALEDAEDSRILDEARRRGAGKPRIPHKRILEEFGLSHLLRKLKRTHSREANVIASEAPRPIGRSQKPSRRKPSRAGAE
jgi:hypothetical protein